jgi:outer membrane protein assembly factor BamB
MREGEGCVQRTNQRADRVQQPSWCIVRTLLACCFIHLPISATAGDWPQILGPHRNGIADDEQLNLDWPGGKPKALWQRDVGDGVAGVAVAEDRVVLFHRVGNQEVVEAMEPISGKVVWSLGFRTDSRPQMSTAGDGPRCVPIIHRGSVYVFGVGGDLRCLSLADGKERWSRAAAKEFQAPEGFFGAGSTPIIEGDKLIVNVGGDRSGAGIVAFDLETGKTVWKATNEQASYAAPTAATVDGVRHVIFATRLNLVSLDPQSGAVRFRFPFGQRGPTVNAATPLVVDRYLFLTASYGIGAVFAKIGKTDAKTLWANNDVMSSQYPTCIYNDGYLYGIHGRQDGPPAALRCFEPKTGKVAWSKEGFGMASLILADGKLIAMKTDGTLVVAEPNPKEFRPLASARVFDNSSREPALALPALAGGLLYVRDTQTLKCLDLRKRP